MNTQESKPIICVDFDGTIIEDGHWPAMGPVLPGAAYALRKLAEHYTLVVYTCRTAPTMPDGAVRSEEDKLIELKAIHDVMVGLGLGWVLIWQDPHKPDAAVYIDNKAVAFRDWGQALVDTHNLVREQEGSNGRRQLVLF